jgi:hypothetical protein
VQWLTCVLTPLASAIKMLSRTAGTVARTTPRMALRKVLRLTYLGPGSRVEFLGFRVWIRVSYLGCRDLTLASVLEVLEIRVRNSGLGFWN